MRPHQGRGQGDDEAVEDDHAHVGVQGARGGQGAGGGRNHGVGGVEAGGQGHSHDRHGGAALGREGLVQRTHDHIAGVAEDRDGDDIAGHIHGQRSPVLADQAENGPGHDQGRAGLFQDVAHDRSGDDHDADAGQGAAEAVANGLDHVQGGHADGQTVKEGHADENNEGVDLPASRGQDDERHGHEQENQGKRTRYHVRTPSGLRCVKRMIPRSEPSRLCRPNSFPAGIF